VTAELQSFIHGYQDETGLEPGPYAAEAYDAAAIVAAAWQATGTRAGVAQAVADLDAYEGVAGTYRWRGPVLVGPGPRTYAALGWRWVRRP
jgi:ABC-type branched-subunit amino acid transport system substrate-binding protein